jgi:glutathione S-transferase
MLLYDSVVSGNCYKVRLLLAHLGIEYERREVDVVDRSDREELLGELNPALRVPTLVFDDGRALGESNAIIWHVASGSEYLPGDEFERAQVLQWMFFEQYSHEPYIAALRFLLHVAGRELPERELRRLDSGATAALQAMERHLAVREYLVGDHYSIADISLYAYTHVADEAGLSLDPYPGIRAWLGRVAAQPGHVAIDA